MKQNLKYGILLLGILAITLFISIYFSNFKNSIEGIDNSSPEKYKPDNTDVVYHASVDEIAASSDSYGLISGTAYTYDQSGNKVALPPGVMANNVTYYQPGTYKYGATTYVPSYEDSVYLSRTTGLPTTLPMYDESSYNMCQYHRNNPDKLEEACQRLGSNDCAKSSCCVLLGGVKCVSGDKHGPAVQSNYSDVYVKNRDFYYYKNRCYGNCDTTIYKAPIYPVTRTSGTLNPVMVNDETASSLLTPTDSTWKTSTASTWGSSNTLAWAVAK